MIRYIHASKSTRGGWNLARSELRFKSKYSEHYPYYSFHEIPTKLIRLLYTYLAYYFLGISADS